jgi:hypothetical protein
VVVLGVVDEVCLQAVAASAQYRADAGVTDA